VVGGGVALRIRLGFHDSAAQASSGKFAHDNFADQKTREGHRVGRKFSAAEAAYGNGSFGGVRGWQARQSSGAVWKSNITPDLVLPAAVPGM
jgi:hypothetical protein